jgi:pyruvate dehydrogenase E2 component (dihydrolipoamide acetyltransferase)
MTAARATIPDFDVEVNVDMSGCLALREQLRAHVERPPTLTDMVVKACALALRAHPRVNGSYRDEGFALHDQVDVGVAVAADDALLVPVVRGADAKSLGAIAAVTRELAAKARERRLAPAELVGATFTVSNLGMFGVSRFTAVIDAPQAAILAVGAVEERPVGRGGEIVLAPMMTATLACDHRIVYGADAARFLADVRSLLEAPIQMLL